MTGSQTDSNTMCVSISDESPTEAVVSAVAAAEGVDEIDLQPLYDVCDPDALNSIFQSTLTGASSAVNTVEFQYHGYTVRVHGNGEVEVVE